jgi:hypothetical protein
VADIDAAPAVINLVEPDAPTRQHLLSLWLQKRPDLASIWMPSWVLSIMSPMAKLAQKILLPKSTPIDLAAAFSSEQYDAAVAARMIQPRASGGRCRPSILPPWPRATANDADT